MKTACLLLILCAGCRLAAQAGPAEGAQPAGPEPAPRGRRAVDQAPRVYFSHEFKQPVNVLDYFPLRVGTRWSYRHITKDQMGPDMLMITVQWVEDIRIAGHKDLPEGKLILRETSVRGLTCEHPAGARSEDVDCCRQLPSRRTHLDYLVQGNYVFEVSEYDLDLERLEWLHDGFRRHSGPREPLPCLFFPLDKVQAWAERSAERKVVEEARLSAAGLGPAPNPGNYFWHVMGREEVVVPYGRVKDAMHLHYGTLGGPSKVWFKEGIGIIRATTQRNPDFLSEEVVLLEFTSPKAEDTESR